MYRFHVWMDMHCKYVVTVATAIVTVALTPFDGRSMLVPMVTAMSVVSALVGKVVKRVLQHGRPDGSRKGDHGMPSSHALALSYLSVSATLGLVVRSGWAWSDSSVVAPALVVLGLGGYWTALRVYLGDHTVAQVAVGYGMGALSSIAVFAGNFYGYTGRSDGGRVDEFTTQTQRMVLTNLFAAICMTVLVAAWRRWRVLDVALVANESTRRRRSGCG